MEMRQRFDDTRARQYSDNADFAAKSRRKSTPPSALSAPKNKDNATKKRNSNVVNDVGTAAAIAGGTPLAASLGKAAISAATHTTRKGAHALTQWGKFLLSGNKGARRATMNGILNAAERDGLDTVRAITPLAYGAAAGYLGGKYIINHVKNKVKDKLPKMEIRRMSPEEYRKKYGDGQT